MRSLNRHSIAALVCLPIVVSTLTFAQRGSTSARQGAAPADATARIVASAQAVVAALDETGRQKVQFPFEGPQKTRWSNLPTGIFERQGLRMGDLTAAQEAAVRRLLETALSANGYRKVIEIMRGDEVLRTGGGGAPRGGAPGGTPPAGAAPPPGGRAGRGGRGGGPTFGEGEYYLAFLGTPSIQTPWMLQFGGHHLAINLTMAGSQASMTPSLPAAQPATYSFEGREIRPLGRENDKAFELINGLGDTERKQAIIGARVADLILGPGQDGKVIQPEGLRASAMSQAQQTLLLEIIREWAGIMNDAFATPRMAEIRANLADTYFAWSGPTTPGSAAYFRIQGPTLVIEYAPQGGVDHIHTIYRDPTNDYGAKLAKGK
jgi:uncharacterized protein DUF3500